MVGKSSSLFRTSWDSPLFLRHEVKARANTHTPPPLNWIAELLLGSVKHNKF